MFRPPASAHGGRARAFRRSDRRPSAAIQPMLCTQNFVYKKSPARKILAGDGGERLPQMPSKSARPDQRRAKRGIPNPQTASRTAENGLSNVVAPSIGAVCVRSAAAGGIVEIPPPTIGANVVKFSLASHTAGVESPVRRALVRQNHQRQPVPARNGRSCAPLACAHSPTLPPHQA